MKVILSPAKKLNYQSESFLIEPSEIRFADKSENLIKKLQKMSSQEIAKLMKLSPKLADLNFERYQNWKYPFEEQTAKPAAFAFDGEAYTGLDIRSFNKEELSYCNEHLCILSGLYGLLRPMDAIFPYRLEMGTSLKYSEKIKNLYQYWDTTIYDLLAQTLKKDELLVNLASNEYSKAAKLKSLSNKVITPTFKEYKNGEHKVIMVYAKKARGQMTNYIMKNKIQTLEELKTFDVESYTFDPSLSTETEPVFTR